MCIKKIQTSKFTFFATTLSRTKHPKWGCHSSTGNIRDNGRIMKVILNLALSYPLNTFETDYSAFAKILAIRSDITCASAPRAPAAPGRRASARRPALPTWRASSASACPHRRPTRLPLPPGRSGRARSVSLLRRYCARRSGFITIHFIDDEEIVPET